MKRVRILALLVFGLFAVSCGGDDSPTGTGGGGGGGNNSGGNSFTATIDGQPFKSDANLIQITGNNPATRQGTLVITGYQTSTGTGMNLIISFFQNVPNAVTQPLGVNTGTTPGGTASVIKGVDSWMTPLNGASGFVTVTERTDTHIKGTFFCTTEGILPSITPPTRVVTNGAFDITVASGLPPLPTSVGSTSVANLGGTPWNAATVVGLSGGTGVFSTSADNTNYSITFVPKMPVSAGNTYGIPSQIGMTVINKLTADSWWGGTGSDIGTMTINQLDSNRLYANFSGTLPPLSGSGSLTVSNGAINTYLEHQ